MEEVTLKSLDNRIVKQVENAQKALDNNNPSYAIDIYCGILSRFPNCVEIRYLLRNAQKKIVKKSKFSQFFGKFSQISSMGKAKKLLKENPEKALYEAEKILSVDVENAQAHKTIGEAAIALNFHKTAVLGYEEFYKLDPENVDKLLLLGNAYNRAGKIDQAIQCGDEALRIDPSRSDAQDLIKSAAVSNTMQSGNWEEDGDYRSKLKDESQTISLEQSSRMVNDQTTLLTLIESTIQSIEETPENIGNYKNLADYYYRSDQLEKAILSIQKGRETPAGKIDATLEELEDKYRREVFLSKIKNLEETLKLNPQKVEIQEALDQERQNYLSYKLERAKALVEKYPNEYALRFELGVLLFDQGCFKESIQHFQLSQKGSKIKQKSIFYLGRALMQDGKYDLAIEQLEQVKGTLNSMNELKKEVVYNLGIAYENANNPEASITAFKLLYANDISYKDVSQKIDAFYAKD